MDSFKFNDIKIEKAKAISRYRRIQRITSLFRYVELFVFLFIVSKFSAQFAFSNFKLSAEQFRGISSILISPKFVFVLVNAIVFALLFTSREFSPNNCEKSTDFYEEYVEKCRKINKQAHNKEEEKSSDALALRYAICSDEQINIRRSHSANNLRSVNENRKLRRSTTERNRKITSVNCGQNVAKIRSKLYVEDEMSGEDFRRTVEDFIARRQRLLKEEEEDFSAALF